MSIRIFDYEGRSCQVDNFSNFVLKSTQYAYKNLRCKEKLGKIRTAAFRGKIDYVDDYCLENVTITTSEGKFVWQNGGRKFWVGTTWKYLTTKSCGMTNVADLTNSANISASSSYGSTTPEHAFNGMEWHSGNGMPQFIEYDFKTPKTICSVSFLPRSDNYWGNVDNDCPQSWQLLGSDDGVSWVTLLDVPTEDVCEKNVRIQQNVPIPKSFYRYKLKTLKVMGRSTGRSYVVLRDIQMYESTAFALTASTQSTITGPQYTTEVPQYTTADHVPEASGDTFDLVLGTCNDSQSGSHASMSIRIFDYEGRSCQVDNFSNFVLKSTQYAYKNLRCKEKLGKIRTAAFRGKIDYVDDYCLENVTITTSEGKFVWQNGGRKFWVGTTWKYLTTKSCGMTNVADLTNSANISASSSYGSTTPEHAFNGMEWHSGNGMPQFIEYDFKTPKTICSVSFLPRSDNYWGNVDNDCPQSWQLLGSDDGVSWVTLLDVPTEDVCEKNVRIQQNVPIPKSFYRYKLKTLKVMGRSTGRSYVVLRDIQMYESTAFALTASTQSTITGPQYTTEVPQYTTADHVPEDVDECASNPCRNGGICEDGVNDYECKCDIGWQGPNCEQSEKDIDDCASKPCQNGGICNDRVNDHECKCQIGWQGKNCEQHIDDCATDSCQNEGFCWDGTKVKWMNCDKNSPLSTSVDSGLPLRLIDVDGRESTTYGLIQIFHDGRWGTICDDWLEYYYEMHNKIGDVICRQLGNEKGGTIGMFDPDIPDWHIKFRHFPAILQEAKVPIWMNWLWCVGDEKSVENCQHKGVGNNEGCVKHDEDLYLDCN